MLQLLLLASLAFAGGPDWNELQSAVLIQVRRPQGNSLCSGVMIAKRAALTAAHCVDGAIGIAVLTGPEPSLSPTATLEARDWWPHPKYDRASSLYQYDIAMIRLELSVPDSLVPARLATARDLARAGATRWERVGFGGRNGQNLRTWTDPTFVARENPAAVKLRDHFAFEGDSGGPVYFRPFPGSPLLLAGIHSTWDRGGFSFAVSVLTLDTWLRQDLAAPL